MPEPKRPSRRARHPLIIAGNAIFTIILMVAIAVGRRLVVRQAQVRSARARSIARRSSISRAGSACARSPICWRARTSSTSRGCSSAACWCSRRRDDLKYGEYKFAKQITLREAIETIVEGKVVQHAFTIPEGLTSEQIVDAARRGRFPRRQYPRDPEGRHAAARDLQLPARHDARAGDPAHAAVRTAACCRRSGIAACRTCRSGRRRRW